MLKKFLTFAIIISALPVLSVRADNFTPSTDDMTRGWQYSFLGTVTKVLAFKGYDVPSETLLLQYGESYCQSRREGHSDQDLLRLMLNSTSQMDARTRRFMEDVAVTVFSEAPLTLCREFR